MYQDVGRLTEHRFAHSLSEAPTNSSHADSGSFESASSPPVLPVKVRPHPRQTHLWVPSASRPRLATCEQPHLGHSPGSRADPPATSDSLILSASSSLSSAGSASASCSMLLSIRASCPSVSWSNRRLAGDPDINTRTGLTAIKVFTHQCRWWLCLESHTKRNLTAQYGTDM